MKDAVAAVRAAVAMIEGVGAARFAATSAIVRGYGALPLAKKMWERLARRLSVQTA